LPPVQVDKRLHNHCLSTCSAQRLHHHAQLPGGSNQTGQANSLSTKERHVRKVILALTAAAALGAVALPSTQASAHWNGGWHRWHHGWNHHVGYRHHRWHRWHRTYRY
jgi:hypothetical protein